jgi:hypothetical protein
LRYKSLTSFYGSVPRPLAFDETGEKRSYKSVEAAVQEAVKLGETGPFSLVTVFEIVTTEPGGQSSSGPPPIYWQPPPPREPVDPAEAAKSQARRQLQEDVASALINFGSKKGDAVAIAKALPIEITELSPALNWAMRRK